MFLKDYAQNCAKSTDAFIEAVSQEFFRNIAGAGNEGWTMRPIDHHFAENESQIGARLRRMQTF